MICFQDNASILGFLVNNILPLYQTTKYLVWSKLKAFADYKMNLTEKIKTCFGKGRKHCGKRRKCWLPAFSPFPTMFSKAFLFRIVKTGDCVVKS